MPSAVVIGDSIAIGWNVPADAAWPLIAADRLGWNLTDLAEGGAGFTKAGVNTHDFDGQVSAAIRLRPQVVIIAATINDAGTAKTAPGTVKTATQAAVERLSNALPNTTIIGVGAVWGAAPAPALSSVMDDALRNAVLAAGGHWLAIGQTFVGRTDLMQTDGIHPNAAGQSLLGKTVAEAIAQAGIEPGLASE
jgi:lysophospholipase L1-like esterase